MSPICQSKQEYAHTDIVDVQKTPTQDGKEGGRDQRDDVDQSSLQKTELQRQRVNVSGFYANESPMTSVTQYKEECDQQRKIRAGEKLTVGGNLILRSDMQDSSSKERRQQMTEANL